MALYLYLTACLKIVLYLSLTTCLKIVHCNEDIYAEQIEGTRENSINYVIGDNLY